MRKTIYKTEARSAIIAAVVALVVAAPLSNAAHEGVSSAVKIVKGKQGKTGKRGPRGFRGPTGATGPQGSRGLSFDPTFYTVTGSAMVGGGSTGYAGVECDSGPGTKPISSGFNVPEDVSVLSVSLADEDGDGRKGGFRVDAKNNTGTPQQISVTTYCMRVR